MLQGLRGFQKRRRTQRFARGALRQRRRSDSSSHISVRRPQTRVPCADSTHSAALVPLADALHDYRRTMPDAAKDDKQGLAIIQLQHETRVGPKRAVTVPPSRAGPCPASTLRSSASGSERQDGIGRTLTDDRSKTHASDSHLVGNTPPPSGSYHVGIDSIFQSTKYPWYYST